MIRLYFPLADVAALLRHAEAASERYGGYTDVDTSGAPRTAADVAPMLEWAKDAGTYLLSNGRPRLLADGQDPNANLPRAKVVYGRTSDGFVLDPAANDRGAVWDVCAAVCGGDDFVEHLPLGQLTADSVDRAVADGAEVFYIDVSDDQMAYGVDRGPLPTAN